VHKLPTVVLTNGRVLFGKELVARIGRDLLTSESCSLALNACRRAESALLATRALLLATSMPDIKGHTIDVSPAVAGSLTKDNGGRNRCKRRVLLDKLELGLQESSRLKVGLCHVQLLLNSSLIREHLCDDLHAEDMRVATKHVFHLIDVKNGKDYTDNGVIKKEQVLQRVTAEVTGNVVLARANVIDSELVTVDNPGLPVVDDIVLPIVRTVLVTQGYAGRVRHVHDVSF